MYSLRLIAKHSFEHIVYLSAVRSKETKKRKIKDKTWQQKGKTNVAAQIVHPLYQHPHPFAKWLKSLNQSSLLLQNHSRYRGS